MAYVAVRGYRIGEGRPKVILPIIEPTEAQILSRGAEFSTLRADCVEWRLDHWAEPIHSTALLRCLQGLRQVIGSKLLLVTFRSQAEGGEQSCSLEEYSALCRQVCASGCADLLDLELRPTGDALPALIQQAHAAGVKVICSSHDFTGTPPQEELTARMEQMRSAGADIAKLAVMPHRPEDVLELLTATTQMRQVHPELPLVTMSMGALGAVSRLWGEAMGSAMTFASAGKSSAPGQLELDLVNQVLDALRLADQE